MKKLSILILAIIVPVLVLFATTPSYARHRIVIPYSYVGDGWDTVLIVSNTTDQTISPIVYVQNGEDSACKGLGDLDPGDMFVSTFGAISGWNQTPPIPGIFQVYITENSLGENDPSFGAAVAINNSSFGGFGFQQFVSLYLDDATGICILSILPVLPIGPIFIPMFP